MIRKKLKIKMIEKEKTYVSLAEYTGVSETQVSRIVNGHSKGSIGWWEKAAEFLSCETSDIL